MNFSRANPDAGPKLIAEGDLVILYERHDSLDHVSHLCLCLCLCLGLLDCILWHVSLNLRHIPSISHCYTIHCVCWIASNTTSSMHTYTHSLINTHTQTNRTFTFLPHYLAIVKCITPTSAFTGTYAKECKAAKPFRQFQS